MSGASYLALPYKNSTTTFRPDYSLFDAFNEKSKAPFLDVTVHRRKTS